MHPPTAAELMNDAIVRQALEDAWTDSLTDDPNRRHEEGGWIYLNVAGQISIQRAVSGEQALLDLSNPPSIPDSFIVGKFHTHPNPSTEGWEPRPSETDQRTDARHGVPDLIRADDGIHVSGPDSRRGGLTGNAGYPL